MVLAVYFDVALQIPDKLSQLPGLRIQLPHQRTEDSRNHVFAPKCERRCLRSQTSAANQLECCVHKLPGLSRSLGRHSKRMRRRRPVGGGQRQQRPDRSRIRTELLHRLQVKLEVADGPPIK